MNYEKATMSRVFNTTGKMKGGMMLLRLTNVALMLVLLGGFGWSQADSTKSTTYTLEPIKISDAAYPLQAREQKTQARVVAMMLVSENGDIESVQVFKADAVLSQAADETIRQWKFKPVTKDGKAIPVIAKVTFNFALTNENQPDITHEVGPANDFPQHVRVSSTVMEGLALNRVSPANPTGAKGVVTLAIVIGKDGAVADVQVVSGPSELAPAAVDAVRQWRYRPYQLLGRPVDVQATVQINFH
jgi:TonB family protein